MLPLSPMYACTVGVGVPAVEKVGFAIVIELASELDMTRSFNTGAMVMPAVL